uniref:Potassium transporter n=1 Tax=Physcomitrium patens TaxID=3218 RepID=A0A7I4FP04_PHYPA|nr:potassium transporter 7-like isoform X2 [Physcomitrium patens]|eukprot:XP_024372898.1 potassium transporter 7-like isoform X2 [Physcomitrella patens]
MQVTMVKCLIETGGTFALYSLLCRHGKLSLLSNQQDDDQNLSTYKVVTPKQTQLGLRVMNLFEKHPHLRKGLLIVVLLGTCMVIADGVFTPAISVLSAVTGIKVAAPDLPEGVVTAVSCGILFCLFVLQHFGTRRVAFLFAPIVIAWLICISIIGVYNIVVHNPRGIWSALSPIYMYKFLKITGKDGWVSLGGVVLCITGTEAMFADLGHFNQVSIKIAFTTAVYPALLLGYFGQAAYLSKNRNDVSESFYKSIPTPVFWPVFLIATLAAIVGSQAVISATFSIVKQCVSLYCFPRVKVIHTSREIHGQIYIPEINWILFLLCLAITVGFRDTTTIGNAYGLAVMSVMLVTTCLMALVILLVWGRSIFIALGFLIFFGSIELMYISASIMKVPQGGWVPLVISFVFLIIMYIWNYGTSKKYQYDFENKVAMHTLMNIGQTMGGVRVPGIGLYYTELVTGVPPILAHLFTNLPALHEFLVLVSIKHVPVPYIPLQERYLVGRIGSKDLRLYRCVVRYGYKDIHKDDDGFEDKLIEKLGAFIVAEDDVESETCSSDERDDGMMQASGMYRSSSLVHAVDNELTVKERFGRKKQPLAKSELSCNEPTPQVNGKKRVRFQSPDFKQPDPAILRELELLREHKERGVVYILGHSYVEATNASSILKKFAINVVYTFLRRICRGPSVILHIPQASSIEIGVVYRV